jgi:hypothetical protein
MRDFTLVIYKKFLIEIAKMFEFVTFEEYMHNPDRKKNVIILRHDVDKRPLQALRMAELEKELNIKGTYYFRVRKNNFPEAEIRKIAALGHEVGYHYEDLHVAAGDVTAALESFQRNLARLRELAPVKTACMHGSPLSRYDNRELWRSIDYRKFGIIAEPYFEIDFNEVLYLTDTGRMWDGERVNIRDTVRGEMLWVRGREKDVIGEGQGAKGYRKENRGEGQGVIGDGEDGGLRIADTEMKEKECRGAVHYTAGLHLHSTADIIRALNNKLLPDKIMLTVHPQRWTDNFFPWMIEFIWQKMKNPIKSLKRKRMGKMQKK